MRRRLDILIPFVAVTAVPTLAFAESTSVLAAAGNGPWIALAVVGMVRAVLGHGRGSFFDEHDGLR